VTERDRNRHAFPPPFETRLTHVPPLDARCPPDSARGDDRSPPDPDRRRRAARQPRVSSPAAAEAPSTRSASPAQPQLIPGHRKPATAECGSPGAPKSRRAHTGDLMMTKKMPKRSPPRSPTSSASVVRTTCRSIAAKGKVARGSRSTPARRGSVSRRRRRRRRSRRPCGRRLRVRRR